MSRDDKLVPSPLEEINNEKIDHDFTALRLLVFLKIYKQTSGQSYHIQFTVSFSP